MHTTFDGLGMGLGNLARLSDAQTRSISAENPTGAVRVYERAGMRVERTNLIFEKGGRG